MFRELDNGSTKCFSNDKKGVRKEAWGKGLFIALFMILSESINSRCFFPIKRYLSIYKDIFSNNIIKLEVPSIE